MIMTNKICYLCENNFEYKQYTGPILVDEDGSKPCFDCLMEAGAFNDSVEEEVE